MLSMIRFSTETCYSLLWHVLLVTLCTSIVPLFTMNPVVSVQNIVMLVTTYWVCLEGGKLIVGLFDIPLRLIVLWLQMEDGCMRLTSNRCFKNRLRHLTNCYHKFLHECRRERAH